MKVSEVGKYVVLATLSSNLSQVYFKPVPLWIPAIQVLNKKTVRQLNKNFKKTKNKKQKNQLLANLTSFIKLLDYLTTALVVL